MTKPAFTPGPWEAVKFTVPGHEFWVATIKGGDIKPTEKGLEGRANARLIAAAPDMYEALKQVLGWIDSWETSFDDDPEWLETRHRIDAILSKVQP